MSLILTWSPSFALFAQPWEAGAFTADLERFARLIRKETEKPALKLLTKPTPQDVFDLAKSSDFIAFDIETYPANDEEPWTGKDPTRARLRKVGLGNTEWALSHHWGPPVEMQLAIKKVLEDPNILKVGHNCAWFDNRVLARYGVNVTNWADTRDMRRAISTTSQLSLRYCVSLYCDYRPWKEVSEYEEK